MSPTPATLILRGDALRIPLADASVHLIVTSPPYFALRSYLDSQSHYSGQVGDESHPSLYLEALWTVMAECWRVLTPDGSVWINLGDKRSGSGGHNNDGISEKSTLSGTGHRGGVAADGSPNKIKATRRNAPDRYEQAAFGRSKSRQLLPERFIIGCEDGVASGVCRCTHRQGDHHWVVGCLECGCTEYRGMGWIARQVGIWEKANGLPESVQDRTRDDFEYLYHLTKSESYYSAVDEIRDIYSSGAGDGGPSETNPLGKLPGSIWRMATEPLSLPDYFVEVGGEWQEIRKGTLKKPVGYEGGGLFDYPQALDPVYPGLVALWRMVEDRLRQGVTQPMTMLDIDHFAAFPTELPRRIILGWSPPAICLRCGEGRRPVVEKRLEVDHETTQRCPGKRDGSEPNGNSRGMNGNAPVGSTQATILGYACACTPFTDHPRSGNGGMRHAEAIAHGMASASKGQNWGGKQDYSARPKVGPWREYHLDRWIPPPSRPAVVLDPFCGTGTTVGVAQALGRHGVGLDLSADYARLACWRVAQPKQWAKATARSWAEAQGMLL